MTDTNTSPRLSVTVTNYNYADYLPRNIESVLSQSFEDLKLIVIDNASTDNSVELVQKYADGDPRVRLIAHEVNQGSLASFRESCDVSRGRYRVQVDADDWVRMPDALERQVRLLDANPQMTFAFSALTMEGDDGQEPSIYRPFQGDQVTPRRGRAGRHSRLQPGAQRTDAAPRCVPRVWRVPRRVQVLRRHAPGRPAGRARRRGVRRRRALRGAPAQRERAPEPPAQGRRAGDPSDHRHRLQRPPRSAPAGQRPPPAAGSRSGRWCTTPRSTSSVGGRARAGGSTGRARGPARSRPSSSCGRSTSSPAPCWAAGRTPSSPTP